MYSPIGNTKCKLKRGDKFVRRDRFFGGQIFRDTGLQLCAPLLTWRRSRVHLDNSWKYLIYLQLQVYLYTSSSCLLVVSFAAAPTFSVFLRFLWLDFCASTLFLLLSLLWIASLRLFSCVSSTLATFWIILCIFQLQKVLCFVVSSTHVWSAVS